MNSKVPVIHVRLDGVDNSVLRHPATTHNDTPEVSPMPSIATCNLECIQSANYYGSITDIAAIGRKLEN